MLNRLIKLGLGAVLVVLVVYMLSPSPIEVDVSEVSVKPLTVSVQEEGKTRVIDRFVISAPVSGYLRRVDLDVGDSVKQGDILAQLEPLKSDILDSRTRAQAQAQLKAAESALQVAHGNMEAAKADMDFAQTEYDRKSQLAKAKTISQEEVDLAYSALRRTKANFRSASFAVEVAKFEVEVAQTTLEQYVSNGGEEPKELVKIKSPVDGQILKIARESEGAVSLSDPILELGNPSALEVEVDVLSMDAVKIKKGSQVQFTHWGGQEPLEGVVRLIEPIGFTKVSALGVEEQRVLVIADLISPSNTWQKLGDGYRVEANFIIWHEDKALQVPSSSLFRKQDKWAVFAVVDNKAVVKDVEVGQTNGLQTQILAGLDAGDKIVTYPESNLKQNQKVVAQHEF